MIGFAGAFALDWWTWLALAAGALLAAAAFARFDRWALQASCTVAGIVLLGTGLWVLRSPDPRWWHLLLTSTVVIAAVVLPRQRRILVIVPLVAALVGSVYFIDRGRDHLQDERAATEASTTYAKACSVGNRFAGLGLVDAATRQLEKATAAKPATLAVHPQCRAAAGTLRELDTTFNAATATPQAAASAASGDVPMVTAFQTGVESTLEPYLRPALLDGEDQAPLVWGPLGWLALGLMALGLLLTWTRLYSAVHRRATRPSVDLNNPVPSGDDQKADAAILGAELRVALFERDLRPSATASATTDQVAVLVESTEVSGAKVVAAMVRLLRQVLSTSNSITVDVAVISPHRIVLTAKEGSSGKAHDIHAIEGDNPKALRRLAVSRIRWAALTRAGTRHLSPCLYTPEKAMYHLLAAESLDAEE